MSGQAIGSYHLPLRASLPEIMSSTAGLAEGHGTTSQLRIREQELTWDKDGALCCLLCLPTRLPYGDS